MNLADRWDYIEEIAAARLKTNKTRWHVSEYGTKIEVIGAAGELAARRFFMMNERLHTGFDGGVDIVHHGIRINVKATFWTKYLQYRNFQYRADKYIDDAVFLMTAVDIRRKQAIIVGYALPEEVMMAPVNNQRAYPCHEIPIPKLQKASKLLNATRLEDLYPCSQGRTHHTGQHHRTRA